MNGTRKAFIFSLEALLSLVSVLSFLFLVQAMPASEISYSSIRQNQLLQDMAETGVRGNRQMFESWDATGINNFYEPLLLEAGNYCLELRKLEKSGDDFVEKKSLKVQCGETHYSTVLKTRRLLRGPAGFYYVDFYLKQ